MLNAEIQQVIEIAKAEAKAAIEKELLTGEIAKKVEAKKRAMAGQKKAAAAPKTKEKKTDEKKS
jgi:hypothetical protein